VKNVVTHRKTGTCRFENYEREGERERGEKKTYERIYLKKHN